MEGGQDSIMRRRIRKELRFYRIYIVFSTLVLLVLVVSAFTDRVEKVKFEEIDVERINIVEKDGKLQMVISNLTRQHPGIVNGKIIKRDGPRAPGILFFNHLGDEMGGLIFGENGGNGHFGSLTFDKVRNDQTMGFRYLESDNGKYLSGIEMWQQPNIPSDVMQKKYDEIRKLESREQQQIEFEKLVAKGEAPSNRLFLGKGRDDVAMLRLHDIYGRVRVRLSAPPNGDPRLEFLDEDGNVTNTFPPASK